MTRSKPSSAAIGSAKTREAARYQRGAHSRGASVASERARPRHQPNMCRGLVEHGLRQARQQGDPLGEGCDKIEFAIHRPPRDLGDLGPQPDEIGQFLEHLVFDDGRFQVGDEHPLAPPLAGLDHDIDRRVADRLAGRCVDSAAAALSISRSQASSGASQSAFACSSLCNAPIIPASRAWRRGRRSEWQHAWRLSAFRGAVNDGADHLTRSR